jgi:myo-inositol-1(or 4)-monophosphatase
LSNDKQDNLDLELIGRAAESAAIASSEALMARFRPDGSDPLDTFFKAPYELVTDADLASDRAIAQALQDSGAPGRILSEESETVLTDDDLLVWHIDPLCGTVPFSTGLSNWGVNIAARHHGDLVAAELVMPSLGERLSALKGRGVLRNGEPFVPTAPNTELSKSTIGLEIGHPDLWRDLLGSGLDWIPSIGNINAFSSATYPIGQVCFGRMSAVVLYSRSPARASSVHLDAGVMVAEQLGVIVTDIQGKRIDGTSTVAPSAFVIGWPDVHAELLQAMNA